MSDELFEARWNVKRAVMDLVAWEFHEISSDSDIHHYDYLSDMLDEALKEYAEVYQMVQMQDRVNQMKDNLDKVEKYSTVINFESGPKGDTVFIPYLDPRMPN